VPKAGLWGVDCGATELPLCGLASMCRTTPCLLLGFSSVDELLQIMERFPNTGKGINPSTSLLPGSAESHGTC